MSDINPVEWLQKLCDRWHAGGAPAGELRKAIAVKDAVEATAVALGLKTSECDGWKKLAEDQQNYIEQLEAALSKYCRHDPMCDLNSQRRNDGSTSYVPECDCGLEDALVPAGESVPPETRIQQLETELAAIRRQLQQSVEDQGKDDG